MESPLWFFRMHWDRESIPNPSQEGNRQDADERLLPSWEGSGVGRFMDSNLDPRTSVLRAYASMQQSIFGRPCPLQSRVGHTLDLLALGSQGGTHQ